jgi:6-pyruvoyltetrahydropterin/6-carboxytetrahydropterin synthase
MPEMEIFREFTFEAAHQVPPYTDVHGHTFVVEVMLKGKADPVYGWAMSLTDLEPHIEAVRRDLDHKYLNDLEGLAVPSLENVACWIWRRLDDVLQGLDRVTVRRGFTGNVEGCTYRGPLQ